MNVEHIEKTSMPNKRIKCYVNSCHYYMEGDHCAAEKIEVQPKNATNSDETDCATFLLEEHNDEDRGIPNLY